MSSSSKDDVHRGCGRRKVIAFEGELGPKGRAHRVDAYHPQSGWEPSRDGTKPKGATSKIRKDE
jgi:hypothetical protein